MSLLNVLSQIDTEQFEDEAKDRFLNRKDALNKMGNFGKKLALSAIPAGAFAAFSTPALAKSDGHVLAALNFALTLEYLEAEYYQTGLDTGIVDSDAQTIYEQINQHEQAHVTYLQAVINQLGGTPVESPEFDFTAGGAFAPFENYQTFLTLSQAFEDTGVRAYKGQAVIINNSDLVLTRALQVHSVEARHAAEVRRLRGLNGWITGGAEGEQVPDAAAPVYAGEDQTTQAGVDISQIVNAGDVDTGDITEAWDEPLTMDQVFTVANLFVVDNSGG
jgi:hypothetical protein